MANIVKITEVHLYSGLTAEASECFECKKVLNDNGIKHISLFYGDDPQGHNDNFAALSTWSFGPEFKQYTFTKFPIVTWKEYYDDYERWIEVAQSSTELLNSNLVKNKALVK